MMIRWTDLRREPFRLFFPLGTVFGLVGVTHWLVYALGWTGSYSGFYHAGIQVAYMLGFVIGFLLTALPRFASTAPATTTELVVFLTLFMAQPVLLSVGQWMAAQAAFAGLLVALAVFAGRRFTGHRAEIGPPTEFVWIGLAVLHGLIGSGLMISAQAGWLPARLLAVGRPMAQQGFLLSIVLGVGGFMAPRLMGRRALLVTPEGVSEARAIQLRAQRVAWHLLAGFLLASSFFVEGSGAVAAAYGLRAAVVTAELVWTTQLFRPPAAPDLYVKFVWVSLWMVLCGLWGAALAPARRVAMLHLVFLGGFSVMVFAVGTMVVLSHSGAGTRLRQPLWVLHVVGAGIAVAVIARLAADALPARFFQLLGVAAASWSVAAISWLVFSLPYVVRAVPAGTFERLHEEAKRKLSGAHAASSL